MIEASLLSFTGGIIGVGTGYAAATLVARFSQMTTLVTPDIVVLAISVSIVIGLFFGFYPVWNASHLDPIQALKVGIMSDKLSGAQSKGTPLFLTLNSSACRVGEARA